MLQCRVVTSLMRGRVVTMGRRTQTHSVQCTRQVTAQLLWYYFASHLLSICLWYLPNRHTHINTHTHRGRPWIQASLTLNLAQPDSNFCLQITFQWLHKSAASSSASFSLPRLPASLSFLLLSHSSPFPLPLLLRPHFIFPVPSSPSSSCFAISPPSAFPPNHLFSRFPTLLSGAGSVNEKQGGRDGAVTCAG